MTRLEKQRMLTWNTMLWVETMILPIVFHVTFDSRKFPWFVILPCLLLGLLLASNSMLARAIGEPTDSPATERKN